MDNILKAVQGNKKAIKSLIEDNIEDIYKLIFLHTKYEDDSKIILRDTIEYIQENITKLNNTEEVILWMYKIIIINTNNFLESIGMVENDYKCFKGEKIDLYKAIDLLDGKYKSAVILKYYFDLSYEEIGQVVNLNPDTVQIYIRQSLKKIKASVGEYL